MDAQTNSPTLDKTFRRIHSVFEMHGVRFGAPDCLPEFFEKLRLNRHFAMDFWALTGKLSSREYGELSDDEMLTVLVKSITGKAPQELDVSAKQAIDQLARLLAGEDIESPINQNDQKSVQAAIAPAVTPEPVTHAEETEPSRMESTAEDKTHKSLRLDEALARLELHNLEMKMHLDEINRKMNTLEPHLQALKPVESFVAEPISSSQASPRLILKPDPTPVFENSEARPDLGDIAIPLENYEGGRSYRNAIIAVVLLLLAGGGVFVHQHYGFNTLWQQATASWVQHYDALKQEYQASHAQAQPAQSVANSLPAAPTANPNPNPSPVTTNPVVTPQSQASPAPTAPPPSPTPSLQTPKASESNASARHAKTTSSPKDEDSAEELATLEDPAGLVQVPGNVMEDRLTESRIPIYPESAKDNGIGGRVVLQAFISKAGTVAHVRAISGDPALRAAAIDAVRKWRYEPYLINGHPVGVATTVTVNFSR